MGRVTSCFHVKMGSCNAFLASRWLQLIKGNKIPPPDSYLMNILGNIKRMLSNTAWNTNLLSHIYREANRAAVFIFLSIEKK